MASFYSTALFVGCLGPLSSISVNFLGKYLFFNCKAIFIFETKLAFTPCPSALVRCDPVASPVNEFVEIASLVSNYDSAPIKRFLPQS